MSVRPVDPYGRLDCPNRQTNGPSLPPAHRYEGSVCPRSEVLSSDVLYSPCRYNHTHASERWRVRLKRNRLRRWKASIAPPPLEPSGGSRMGLVSAARPPVQWVGNFPASLVRWLPRSGPCGRVRPQVQTARSGDQRLPEFVNGCSLATPRIVKVVSQSPDRTSDGITVAVTRRATKGDATHEHAA